MDNENEELYLLDKDFLFDKPLAIFKYRVDENHHNLYQCYLKLKITKKGIFKPILFYYGFTYDELMLNDYANRFVSETLKTFSQEGSFVQIKDAFHGYEQISDLIITLKEDIKEDKPNIGKLML